MHNLFNDLLATLLTVVGVWLCYRISTRKSRKHPRKSATLGQRFVADISTVRRAERGTTVRREAWRSSSTKGDS